jgi:hypothetical protein
VRVLVPCSLAALLAASPAAGGQEVKSAVAGSLSPDSLASRGASPGSSFAGSARRVEPGPILAFAPGERLEFVLTWMGIAAGDSLMEVDRQSQPGGGEAWRVSSVTTSRSVVDLVYRVRNRYETWLDPATGLSVKYVIHQDEGGKKKDQVQVHDQERSEVTLLVKEKGASTSKVFPVPRGSVDTLAALYLIRDQKLAPGDRVAFPVFEGRKIWELIVEVVGREEVETGAGRFSTLKLHPLVKYEGIFRRKGDLFVWVTDDDRRMPVLMKSSVTVGSINAELVRYAPQAAP